MNRLIAPTSPHAMALAALRGEAGSARLASAPETRPDPLTAAVKTLSARPVAPSLMRR